MTEEEKNLFFMESNTDEKGNVGFLDKDKAQEIAEKISESINYAVLVLNDKDKEDVCKLFNTQLVFNVQEAKGLEFKNVILYKFDEAYEKIWDIACKSKGEGDIKKAISEIRSLYDEKDVNISRPKDKEGKSFEENKFYVNALYVAATRAIDSVYICDDESKKGHSLLKVIKPEEKGNVDIEKEESSPEEWRDMALKLIGNGNIEQAKDIAIRLVEKQERERVKEIVDALKAGGWDKEAEEIQSLYKDKLGQVEESFLGLDINREDKGASASERECKQENSEKLLLNLKDMISKRRNGEFKRKFQENSCSVNDCEELLLYASGRNNVSIVRYLIVEGASVNAKVESGVTPLHIAVENSHKDVVEILLKKGAEVNAEADRGFTPLHIAVENSHKDVVEILLKKGAEVNAEADRGCTPLYMAAQCGHTGIVEILLKKGANVNAETNEGSTPLHMAVRNGHKDVVEVLLEKGANVNAETNDGFTPLHTAAQYGHTGIVEILLKRGAEVNAEADWGYTPLHIAAQCGHAGIVEILLKKGVRINACNERNCTPLHIAVGNGHKDVVEVLLEKGANVNAKGDRGFTPLYTAIQKGDKDMVEILLKKGANVNAKGDRGFTPLYTAIQKGDKDMVEILLKKGANVNASNNEGHVPLALALKHGYSEVVKLLLSDPNVNIGCVKAISVKDKGDLKKMFSEKLR
ncbi:ankyrin repeat domain-containing protein [Wolbachia endosymbiont of Dactylopius coccus]